MLPVYFYLPLLKSDLSFNRIAVQINADDASCQYSDCHGYIQPSNNKKRQRPSRENAITEL